MGQIQEGRLAKNRFKSTSTHALLPAVSPIVLETRALQDR